MARSYKTNIKNSTIDKLRERVSKKGYPFYLYQMRIVRLRGLEDTEISFDFPVTAIVGPNGSGKSTVLGAAGLTSKRIKPRVFFARSGKYDDSMKNWKIEYQLSNGKAGRTATSNQTASYRQSKWNRDATDRPIVNIGVSRTIPASERSNLAPFIGSKFAGKAEEQLSQSVRSQVAAILGKNAEDYIRVSNGTASQDERATGKAIYAASSADTENANYSEFHFGAGEASIISIVDEIEAVENNALILIEEIENGLHPVATRSLVEYLVRTAERKNLQVIFSTHSNDALLPLPNDAVWYASSGKLYQGKLDVTSLRVLTGEVSTSLAILTEDHFAKLLVEGILRQYRLRDENGEIYMPNLDEIDVHAVSGEAQVRQQTKILTTSPVVGYPVIGILDGDVRRDEAISKSVTDWNSKFHPTSTARTSNNNPGWSHIGFLPGDDDPERIVFETIVDSFSNNSVAQSGPNFLAKITQGLGLPVDQQQWVQNTCESLQLETQDFHYIFSKLGEQLNFIAEPVVQNAFISAWCECSQESIEDFLRPVSNNIPVVRS